MEKIELLAFKKEELQAKFKALIGTDPDVALTKDQLADAIVAKIAEGSKPSTPDPSADVTTPDPDAALTKEVPAIKPGHLHLIKKDANGNVIDEIHLPEAAYNNLPKGTKSEWQLKTPEEVAS
jgi:hypothetical protein